MLGRDGGSSNVRGQSGARHTSAGARCNNFIRPSVCLPEPKGTVHHSPLSILAFSPRASSSMRHSASAPGDAGLRDVFAVGCTTNRPNLSVSRGEIVHSARSLVYEILESEIRRIDDAEPCAASVAVTRGYERKMGSRFDNRYYDNYRLSAPKHSDTGGREVKEIRVCLTTSPHVENHAFQLAASHERRARFSQLAA